MRWRARGSGHGFPMEADHGSREAHRRHRRRRHRLRLRQHRDGPRREELHPPGLRRLDRVVSVVRTLVAHEEGAIGPDKDCGYEGPVLKAITGIPISMEGKTSACAHFEPGGQRGRGLPICGATSRAEYQAPRWHGPDRLPGAARLRRPAHERVHPPRTDATLQKLLVDSDITSTPRPSSSRRPASSRYRRRSSARGATSRRPSARQEGPRHHRGAHKAKRLALTERELEYIDRIRGEIAEIPADESAFVEMMLPNLDTSKVILKEYGL